MGSACSSASATQVYEVHPHSSSGDALEEFAGNQGHRRQSAFGHARGGGRHFHTQYQRNPAPSAPASWSVSPQQQQNGHSDASNDLSNPCGPPSDWAPPQARARRASLSIPRPAPPPAAPLPAAPPAPSSSKPPLLAPPPGPPVPSLPPLLPPMLPPVSGLPVAPMAPLPPLQQQVSGHNSRSAGGSADGSGGVPSAPAGRRLSISHDQAPSSSAARPMLSLSKPSWLEANTSPPPMDVGALGDGGGGSRGSRGRNGGHTQPQRRRMSIVAKNGAAMISQASFAISEVVEATS